MQRLGTNDQPLQFSLWWIFSLACFLPLASTLVMIPRPIMFSVGLLLAIFLIVLIFRRDLLRIAPLAGFMTAFFYLFLQYSKTAYHYDVGLGLASIFRYMLFGLVLWAIINGLVSRRAVLIIQNSAITFCVIAVLGGEALGNYIFKNGAERFMGLGHSGAPVGMLFAIVLLIIFHRLCHSLESKKMLSFNNLWYVSLMLLLFIYLYKTGSRQPLGGILLVIGGLSLLRMPIKYSVSVVLSLCCVIVYYGLNLDIFGRIGLLFSRILELQALSSLAEVDTSIGARLRYFEVGVSALIDGGWAFGLGLNSFPGVYEDAVGKAGVAPHNDLLLVLIDFGLIPFVFFLLLSISFIIIKRRQIPIETWSYFLLWFVGFSLNNFFFYWMLVVLMMMSAVQVKNKSCEV